MHLQYARWTSRRMSCAKLQRTCLEITCTPGIWLSHSGSICLCVHRIVWQNYSVYITLKNFLTVYKWTGIINLVPLFYYKLCSSFLWYPPDIKSLELTEIHISIYRFESVNSSMQRLENTGETCLLIFIECVSHNIQGTCVYDIPVDLFASC